MYRRSRTPPSYVQFVPASPTSRLGRCSRCTYHRRTKARPFLPPSTPCLVNPSASPGKSNPLCVPSPNVDAQSISRSTPSPWNVISTADGVEKCVHGVGNRMVDVGNAVTARTPVRENLLPSCSPPVDRNDVVGVIMPSVRGCGVERLDGAARRILASIRTRKQRVIGVVQERVIRCAINAMRERFASYDGHDTSARIVPSVGSIATTDARVAD